MDQRHGLTKSASDRIVSILTSPPTASSQAELGDSEAAGDPDAAPSIASATLAAASLASALAAAPFRPSRRHRRHQRRRTWLSPR